MIIIKACRPASVKARPLALTSYLLPSQGKASPALDTATELQGRQNSASPPHVYLKQTGTHELLALLDSAPSRDGMRWPFALSALLADAMEARLTYLVALTFINAIAGFLLRLC